MTSSQIGTIAHVHRLREIWPTEGNDFTPWLYDNLPLLGQAVGIDLEPVGKELLAVNFRLDILAKDAQTGAKVAIENQLEWSDNSHMGQVLTYAAHFDARTLIWVSPKFYDVHRAAIDWLNRWTGSEIRCFGVEVSVIRIGQGKPAVEFRPVAFPASWRG